MKKILITVFFAYLACQATDLVGQTISPPVIKKGPKIFMEHGRQRTDDYYWMNNREDSNVINHLKAENAYAEAYMKHTEPLQEKLYRELVARIPGNDQSLPTRKNGFWYYYRFEEGKQYPFYARKRERQEAAEQIILNVPELAKNHQVFLLRGSSVSLNNQFLAYGIDTSGDRRSTLYIKDLLSHQLLKEVIPNTTGDYEWANDNKTLYYTVNDHTVRAYKMMKHIMGTNFNSDKEIYTEADSTYSIYISKSSNNKYIFIHSVTTDASEDRWMDANNSRSIPVMVQPRKNGIEYTTDFFEGSVFHIYTNKDAKNFKLVTAPVTNTSYTEWKDVIPANDKAYLQNFQVLKNYYVIQSKENGLTQIKIYNRENKTWKNLNFEQEDYVADLESSTDSYDTDSIRYAFTSLRTPASEYMFNLKTFEKKLLKQQKAGGNFDPSLYATQRLWSTSADGTKVPVSFVYRKDKFKKDGNNPLLLYAYGSYGADSDPYFNSSIISLLDRGISFAIAHVRGGQEMGRDWFEDGRILHKKNTFSDFVDAAQYLVNEKFTSADKLFANGISAGGMLMGGIINMRPDLFRGVIAEVPWMDVITDMYNADLPLTTLEYDQWGDPNKEEHYNYLLSWSPLDNVKPAKYPAIFTTGGLNDTQVPFFSPAKWVAKVRENNLGTNPVLFKVNMGAGHNGESGRFERQKLTALKYAFILDQLGSEYLK
ncbi:MAG: S9 family peptidase [Ginsengibacter sp.]